MSTELKGTKYHTLTRFWKGKDVDEPGLAVQVTARKFNNGDPNEPGHIHVNKSEALALAVALIEFASDTREVK